MTTYVVTGTLTDGRTLLLDEAIPASAGKVRVTVEVIGSTAPEQTLQEWLEESRQRRQAAGVRPLTDAEIEGWVRDVRLGRGN